MQLFKLAAISLLVGLSPFACAESANSAAWQPRADIAAAYILTVNNAPLWQANASKRLPPASLTKLVAALVLLDNPKLSDWITIEIESCKIISIVGVWLVIMPSTLP